jgi:hypothetical protein
LEQVLQEVTELGLSESFTSQIDGDEEGSIKMGATEVFSNGKAHRKPGH